METVPYQTSHNSSKGKTVNFNRISITLCKWYPSPGRTLADEQTQKSSVNTRGGEVPRRAPSRALSVQRQQKQQRRQQRKERKRRHGTKKKHLVAQKTFFDTEEMGSSPFGWIFDMLLHLKYKSRMKAKKNKTNQV